MPRVMTFGSLNERQNWRLPMSAQLNPSAPNYFPGKPAGRFAGLGLLATSESNWRADFTPHPMAPGSPPITYGGCGAGCQCASCRAKGLGAVPGIVGPSDFASMLLKARSSWYPGEQLMTPEQELAFRREMGIEPQPPPPAALFVGWGLYLGAIGASAYHGYKRSGGNGWNALAWGAAGAIFPIITPVVAVWQGFGKRG